MKKIISKIITTLSFLLFCVTAVNSLPAYADIYGAPGAKDCGQAVGWYKGGPTGWDSCWWDADAALSGINLIKNETVFSGGSTLKIDFDTSYVPYTGTWKLRTYICHSETAIRCSVSKSSSYIDSRSGVRLNSETLIVKQNPQFGNASGLIPANSSLCYAFIDVNDGHIAWGTAAARTCAGGPTLPEDPSTCYLNYGSDLNIDMGDIDRNKLSVTPAVGEMGNTKKTLSVLCTRDAAVTANIKFKFTPITVSGSDVISTSAGSLGIAVFYNGKLMSPSDSVTETFEKGYTDTELEFAPVRDASVDPKNIPTGDFKANAVMIMTEQ